MASSGKKGRKVKGKTLALNEFLGDTPVLPPPQPRKFNWADEPEDEVLPAVQMYLPTAPRAARGADVDESLIPRDGPYIGYISNLLFDMEEKDIEDFFGDFNVVSIRLPRDDRSGGKLKGFGYVEFADRAGLVGALQLNETMIKGRRVRIEVSDSSNRDMRRGGMNRDRDRSDNHDPERTMGDWRSGPRMEAMDRGPRREYGMRDMDRDRDRNRDDVDTGGSWRDAPRPVMDDRDRDRDRRDRDGRSFGGPRRFGDRDRRDASPPPEGRVRPKLNLKPRSIPIETDNSAPTESEEKPNRPSIFGDAKPVDTAARERQLERNGVDNKSQEESADDSAAAAGQPPPKSTADPFGGAKPVDTSAREREIEENSRGKVEAAPTPAPRPAKPTAASIFGAAKPVDTATRERQIEERLAKERQAGTEPSKRDEEKSDKPEKESAPAETAWTRRTQPKAASPNRGASPPSVREKREDNHAERHHPKKDDRPHRDGDHHKRDDRHRRDDRRPPPERANHEDKDRSRGKEAKERPPREPRPMPKASEATAPNYVAPNKYSFLEEDAPAE